MSNTVQAWLQQELAIYIDLMLITALRDLSHKDYWQGKPLICLAHRFFPDAVNDLRIELQQHVTSHLKVIDLFRERLGVLANDDLETYFGQIHQALEQYDTEQYDPQEVSLVEQQAVHILVPLNRLFHQLVDLARQESLSSLSSPTQSQRSPSPRMQEEVLTMSSSGTFEEIESSLSQLESQDLKSFKELVAQVSIQGHLQLARRISVVDATHAALYLQLHQSNMRTGIEFNTAVAYIRNELEFIQAKMLKTTTTDTGIQDLESRSAKVGKLIDTMGERFKELLQEDEQQKEQYCSVHDKYQAILSWVDEVRIWYVEAERIRGWIESHIQQLESKPFKDPLDDIEYEYTAEQITGWNKEHRDLEQEVQTFDAQDMSRLRAHVKALTSADDHTKDLTPADTTTIEITFTTLTTLDRLMHLLRRHAYDLQMLTLRMAWEQAHDLAVAWVRSTTDDVRDFIHNKARWRPPPSVVSAPPDVNIRNEIINTLIEFERECAAFDQGQFTETVNAYQDLDDACNVELPSHLESRQVAIEESFEELTHRIAFARQVVEQFLVVTDFLEKADQLKSEGERLRQEISQAEEQQIVEQHDPLNEINFTSEFSERVASFQENTVRLVTSVTARVPYPESLHPTDQQANDDANEVIRMVMGARKSALILFGEALDQSLASLRRAIQLQKRAKQIQDELSRLTGWVDERLRNMKKSKIDVFVAGKCALDETDVIRLKKERDGQQSKLSSIRENDVKQLEESLSAFQQSLLTHFPNNPHAVSQVDQLHQNLSHLEAQLGHLETELSSHSTRLDILACRITWESYHAQSTVWLSNTIFEVWDFISHKAQWRSTVEDDFKEDRDLIEVDYKSMKTKVEVYLETQFEHVQQSFRDLVHGFGKTSFYICVLFCWLHIYLFFFTEQESTTPEHIQRRHDTLNQSFQNLQDLLLYAQQVLDQHVALTQFTEQVNSMKQKGQEMISDIQQALAHVMDQTTDHMHQQLSDSVASFAQDVMGLWMHSGSQLPYPQCPEDARSTRPTTNDDEISTEVATAVYRTYIELQDLVKQLKELLHLLDVSVANRNKLIVHHDQTEIVIESMLTMIKTITEYSFLLSTHTIMLDGHSIELNTCREAEAQFDEQLQLIYDKEYQPLLEQWENLVSTMITEECNAIVDTSASEALIKRAKATWDSLSTQKQQWAQQLKVCENRMTWYELSSNQHQYLEQLQDNVRGWVNEKHLWLSTEGHEQELQELVDRLEDYHLALDQYTKDQRPLLKAAHDKLKESYSGLSSFGKFDSDAVVGTQETVDLDKMVSKLSDLIGTHRSDILIIQKRHEWELRANTELDNCKEKEKSIEHFIKSRARWALNEEDQEEHLLDDEYLDPEIKEQAGTVTQLLKEFEQLEQPTETTKKYASSLEVAEQRMEHHHGFMHDVVAQHQMIQSCLSKINQIEQLAEETRTRFLSLAPADNLTENADLETYKQRVHEVSIHIQTTMKYPVRQFGDHDPQAREEDIIHNSSVAEMISARQSRLVELGHTLSSILKSKERLSRRQAAETSYKAEAEVVREWITIKSNATKELQKPKEMEALRSAVQTINSLQSSVAAYNTSVHGLKEAASKYISVIQQQHQVDEDDIEEVKASVELIEFMQSDLNAAWDMLTGDVAQKQQDFSKDLRYAEFISLTKTFESDCKQLTQNVSNVALQDTTEDLINQWQKDVQALNSKSLEAIKSRVRDEALLLADKENSSTDKMQESLSSCIDQFKALRTFVQRRSTEANHYHLKQEYIDGAAELEMLLTDTEKALDDLTRPPIVIQGLDLEQDKRLLDELTSNYQSICHAFENEHHEKYDEQRSLYRFLQMNKVPDLQLIDQRHTDLEKQWKQVKTNLTQDKHQWIGQLSQWYELHCKLSEMQSNTFNGILDRLEQFDSSSIEADGQQDAVMPLFLEEDAALLGSLKHRMSACLEVAQETSVQEDSLASFLERYNAFEQQVKEADTLLAEKKHAVQQQVDWINCKRSVKSFTQSAEQEVNLLDERIASLSSEIVEGMDTKALEQMHRQAAESYATHQVKRKQLSQQSAMLNARMNELEDFVITDLKNELNEATSDLEDAMHDTSVVNDLIRRLVGLSKSADNIQSWLANCSQAIDNLSQLSPQEEGESAIALELATISQKMADFDKVMQSFRDMSQELSKTDKGKQEASVDDGLRNALKTMVKKVVLPIKDQTEARWNATQDALKQVEVQVEKTTRGVAVAHKIKHLMSLVGETRDFVHGIQLYDYDTSSTISITLDDQDDMVDEKDIIVYEEAEQLAVGTSKELNDIDADSAIERETAEDGDDEREEEIQAKEHTESKDASQAPAITSMPRQFDVESIRTNLASVEAEMKPQIKQELKELNSMMASYDMDLTFKQQHTQVKESIQSLTDLLSKTHVTIKKCLAIGKYLSITDDIEILQSSLEDAVSQSAPHHTLIASSTTFSRTDLQARLIELDARFKYYERKIISGITRAREHIKEVSKVSPKGGEHVSNHFKQVENKWERIKKQFKTRKIELSRTIDTAVDNKDLQSRIRKSSLPTRKASSLLRDRADISLLRQQHQRTSPTMNSTVSSTTASRTASNSRLTLVQQQSTSNRSKFLAPPTLHQHQPSKSASSVKSRTSSQPQQPKQPLNSYVADPDNDLDMEIGRIVNETPYRVKVKMVPGEVGRYWFGDSNPKLAYCRVLKSKMVMVRVGGGWTELSQFLRDHALLEGDFIPRQNRMLSNINAVTNSNKNTIIEEDEEPKSPTIQEGFIETHRAQPLRRSVSPNNQQSQQKPVIGSPSHSASTTTSHHTPGYKDGDKFIAVDQHGNQLEVKMRRAAANFVSTSSSSSTNNSTTTANNSSTSTTTMNGYTKRRIARKKKKPANSLSDVPSSPPTVVNTTSNEDIS
ncbi:hypothetical protein A0J61_02664 [Choanephora cucurbitarum]|uniref:GAR domain-containing protein n=1 Tax=Choanephora cucurbitarum TaxID=101091 RepID=A0A1C7NJW1_9FUNG|nr:hypothetical protein A0J61_02664 [Choanephora cucurbitarum]